MPESPNREIVEKTDSAEISVNAKGDYSYKVKTYADEVLQATDRAVEAIIRLSEQVHALKADPPE